jgi:dihydroorotate dehydrogenase (NAD+) catalytic subunit
MRNQSFVQRKIRVGGVQVNSHVFLGAGVIKSPLAPELTQYIQSMDEIGAVTIGSVTLDERLGNIGTLNWPRVSGDYDTYKTQGGLHANGMRNLGVAKTMDNLPKDASKPVIISVAGYSTADYLCAIKLIVEHQNVQYVKAIEVNCSCPTMDYAPLAYSLESMAELLVGIKKLAITKPLWFKLSPYYTDREIKELSKQYPSYDFSQCPAVHEEFLDGLVRLLEMHIAVISAVIVSNGLPQVSRSSEIQVKKPDGTASTVAGLSGTALKANNLKTIAFMKEHNLVLDIIGCGGVLSKEDVSDYLQIGAAAVQCSGGPIWGNGAEFFTNLTK